VFLVPVPDRPSWHEFAFLAAIPASRAMSGDEPAVIALDSFGSIPEEVRDYIHRYAPAGVYLLGTEAEWSTGHWRLDEGTGNVVADSSGHGNDGVVVGATWVDGKLEFDGIDDFVEIPGCPGVPGSTDRTVAAWIRTTRPDADIVSWGQFGVEGRSWVLRVHESGNLSLDIGGARIVGSTDVCDGTWHHVAATLGAGERPILDTVRLFVDGEPDLPSAIEDGASDGISDSLIGYWKMDESSGITILDSSPSGNDGIFRTDPAAGGDFPDRVAGIFGNGLYFDRNDYIEIENEADFDATSGAFTVACWMKHDWIAGETANDRIVTKGNPYEGGWTLGRYADSTQFEAAAENQSVISGAASPPGIWHHLVGVYSGAVLRLYVDGVSQGQKLIGAIAGNDVPIRIGTGDWCGEPSGSGPFGGRYGGWLDEVAIWKRALLESEIAGLYNGGAGMEIDTSATLVSTASNTCVRVGVFPGSDRFFEGAIEDVRIYDGAIADVEIPGLMRTSVVTWPGLVQLPSGSLDESVCDLAARFWTATDRVVLCDASDYANALAASALAARVTAPLLFFDTVSGLSEEALQVLGNLNVGTALLVGDNSIVLDQLTGAGVAAERMANAAEVIAWTVAHGMDVDYFAAANPEDRSIGRVRKSSLAAPLLAAGREGAVVPLPFDTDWKHPFWYTEVASTQPPGAPFSATGIWFLGRLTLGAATHDFVLANTNDHEYYDLVSIDFDGDGYFGDAGEGPFESADVVEIDGVRYAVTVGSMERQTPGNVKFTHPSAEEMKEHLSSYYDALGTYPEFLCVVGLPDALPFGLANGYDSYADVEDLPTDARIADVDADPFFEIAVGRVLGETLPYATLLAARSLTYDHLAGAPDTWARRSMWVGTFWDSMFMVPHKLANVGFLPTVIQEYDPEHPKSNLSVVVQDDHGGPGGMGGGWNYRLDTLLAPCVLEAGGCDTGGIDEDSLDRLIVIRMLRKGAVAYIGTQRGTPEDKRQYRQDFWNAVTTGATLGQAHRRGLNSMKVTVLEGGPFAHYCEYCLCSEAFYGDPALRIHIPSAPVLEPAHVEASGSTLTAVAPSEYWFDDYVDADQHRWYCYSGAGLHPDYDMSIKYFLAEWRTEGQVSSMVQDPTVPPPLGWPTGDFFLDEHDDGTRSILWRVRFLEFDKATGKVLKRLDRIDYELGN